MKTSIQAILLRRKSKLYVNCDQTVVHSTNYGMVGAIIANIANLGYVLDKELIAQLQMCSDMELVNFYKEALPLVKAQVGLVRHKPMYPNFPEQVANASDAELWINAILHYIGDAVGVRIMPQYKEEPRFPFCELTKAKWIGLASLDDMTACFDSLLEAKSSPSVQDREDIDTFFAEISFSQEWVNRISFQSKETMAYVCSKHPEFFGSLKTATDVLRVVVAMNNGDISLAKNTKFGKISRPSRRLILSTLEGLNPNSVAEDMKRHEGMWIRLGEKLHSGEYVKQYPFTAESFRQLRNGEISTFNSNVEAGLKNAMYPQVLALLKTRPGDFARRLNAIFSKTDDKMAVMDAFRSVSSKVSTPVLWQLYGYFKGREALASYSNRLFLPKGQTSKALKADNNLVRIANSYCIGMLQVITDALAVHYFNNQEVLDGKKVYIDPICKNLLIPTSNRSASTALRQVGRGSRFQIGDTKSTVRLFVYWNDIKVKGDNGSGDRGYTYGSRVDLDLSAIMYDKDWNCLGQCSYTNLRHGGKSGKDVQMVHSGDITSAPNGASEFLDINLSNLSSNVAYIACNVFSFTGQKMNELQTGFMGWMERDYAGSGEIYEPKSVEGRCDLTADATSTCPLILDVTNREIIWADLAITLNGWGGNVHNTVDGAIATADLTSRMSATRASLQDLFTTSIVARGGEIVDNREDADMVIAEDGDISPFDLTNITANWL